MHVTARSTSTSTAMFVAITQHALELHSLSRKNAAMLEELHNPYLTVKSLRAAAQLSHIP